MPRKKRDDDSEQQKLELGLFPKPSLPAKQSSSGRVERVDSRKGFTDALHSKGADRKGIGQATNAMYQEGFGMSTNELYDAYSATRGNRDTLPEEIQDQIMIHEITSKHRVRQHEVKAADQEGVNNELTDVVADQTRQNKGFFGRLFGG